MIGVTDFNQVSFTLKLTCSSSSRQSMEYHVKYLPKSVHILLGQPVYTNWFLLPWTCWRFLKKLAITEGSICYIKHNLHIYNLLSCEWDWFEIGRLIEVSIMFDNLHLLFFYVVQYIRECEVIVQVRCIIQNTLHQNYPMEH